MVRLCGGFLDTSSELTVIPGDSKHGCGPLRVGVYGGQVVSEVSAQVCLSGPSVSSNAPCRYFSSAGKYDWNTHSQQLAESPHRFPDL